MWTEYWSYNMPNQDIKLCAYCQKSNGDFTSDCGHQFHLACIGRNRPKNDLDGVCPICEKYITEISLYGDILREAGMNDTEEFYLKISGVDIMSGMVKCLLETEGSPLEKVLERVYLIYGNISKLIPNERARFIYELTTGDRRIIKFMKAKRLGGGLKIPDGFVEEAWKKDRMELINDWFEMRIYPKNYKIEMNPVLIAAKTRNYELMKRLVAADADINAKHKDVRPITMVCVSDELESTEEKIKFIECFWEYGFGNTYTKYDSHDSPLVKAIRKNDVKLVECLLKKGLISDECLIDTSIMYGNLEMLKVLHEIGGINFTENHLQLAISNYPLELVEYMLKMKDFSSFLKTGSLNLGVYDFNSKKLELLLNHGASFKDEFVKAAAQNGVFDVLKLLIDHGAIRETTYLIAEFNFATLKSDGIDKITEVLVFLLKNGAQIDATDSTKRTALSKLCSRDSNLPIIELFVQLGASTNAIIVQDSQNLSISPILEASINGCPEIFKFLLRNGSNPTVNGSNRLMNCYLYALESQNLETIKLTLPFCDKNSSDSHGKRPIHFIGDFKSETDAIEIFDYLVGLGVKMNTLHRESKHPILIMKTHTEKPNFVMKYLDYHKTVNSKFEVTIEDLSYYNMFDRSAMHLYTFSRQKWEMQRTK